jgi:hypothetical protein
MPRTFVLAALAFLCLAAPPALAAASDQEKFEKKVARFAQPVAALDYAKPRGLCVCQSSDSAVRGLTGVLIYGVEVGFDVNLVRVGCQVPNFNPEGAVTASTSCENWTLLSR